MHIVNLLCFSKPCNLCSSQRLLQSTFFAAVSGNYGNIQRMLKKRKKQNGSKSIKTSVSTNKCDLLPWLK